jgi:PAS domain S-box-containing protein
LVSTAQEKFAQIVNLNLACCNLFGYNKSEMINRKINIFMPNLYSKFHDVLVENFLQSTETKNISKERLVYIKMKSNYITPCYISLKVI